MSVTVFVQHQVNDYDTWRPVFDGFADFQNSSGLTHKSVHRSSADPNDVMVIHGFPTREQADAFLGSSELREAMQNAGVAGPPRIEIYEDAA